jgi:hypothetical protein
VANLFTSQTPSIGDASDGTPGITTGTTVLFAEDGTVTGVRFYATSTVSGTYTAGLWSVSSSDPGTGTLLASKTMGGAPTGGTWNTVTFDTPVSVTTGVAYRVGIFSGAGRYVATVAFPAFAGGSGGLTNGSIFAPPNNDNPVGAITIKQGVFLIDAAFGYPTGGSGGTCYFVDVEFTAGAAPVTGSGALTLPTLTSSGTGTASAAGSAALTLPAITGSGAGSASASGTGTPALPVFTASGAGTASATGSGSLALPAMTATGSGGEPGAETFGARPVISVSTRRPELVVYARPPTLN